MPSGPTEKMNGRGGITGWHLSEKTEMRSGNGGGRAVKENLKGRGEMIGGGHAGMQKTWVRGGKR